MARTIDRRSFLALLAMAGSAAAAPGVAKLGGKRVVVLGAGLAGLAAAWNLQRNGYDVTVVEAQDMPGGRVKTLREPFSNGCFAEAGAVRIYDNHRWTRKYIRLLGLDAKLRAYEEDQGSHLWYLQGKRFVTPADGDWPLDGLHAREKRNPFAMVEEYWGPGFAAVGDPTRRDYPTVSASALDTQTLSDFFKGNGASDAWIQVLQAQEGSLAHFSALAVTALEGAPNEGPHTRTFGLLGGNDQLPKALAASLGSAVRYGTVVRKIAHDDDGVTVTVRDASGQHEIAADHCVCALPFPLLRSIEVAPAFSLPKMEAIAQYGLVSLARVSLQTRTRFWRDDPLGALGGLNMIGTDTAMGRVWNTSVLQPDPVRGMLHVYMVDHQALEFARVATSERAAHAVREVTKFLPRLAGQVEASAVKVWHEDPWQLGAIAAARPGQFHRVWPAARRAEGRVHFAGEHTSVWIGYMNGALESGERCAQEIMSS